MFSPFEKSTKDLEYDDLQLLIEKEFCESLFVEYKSNFPENYKVAKAIAGFANSYGGILIIGADKNSSRNELPGGFPGADNLGDNPKERIRNICRDHISPMPVYQAKYIEVPESEKSVLVIQVDESIDTPHINRDGRIYRRQSSGTDGESVAEDSRTAIDYLYQKGKAGTDVLNSYLNEKRKHFETLSHIVSITNPDFGIEITICPIPLRKRIYDLLKDVSYNEILPSYGHAPRTNVDYDCRYVHNGTYYEELDTYGCLLAQYIESSATYESIRTSRGGFLHEDYSSEFFIFPTDIEYRIKNAIESFLKLLQKLEDQGNDYFGKVKIRTRITNAQKVLFYDQYLRGYNDFGRRVCRHLNLQIPDSDVYASELKDKKKIIDDIFRYLKLGFNLPFVPESF